MSNLAKMSPETARSLGATRRADSCQRSSPAAILGALTTIDRLRSIIILASDGSVWDWRMDVTLLAEQRR